MVVAERMDRIVKNRNICFIITFLAFCNVKNIFYLFHIGKIPKHIQIYTSSHKQKNPRMWGLML